MTFWLALAALVVFVIVVVGEGIGWAVDALGARLVPSDDDTRRRELQAAAQTGDRR